VYDELRKLAAQRLSHETPGQTFEPTALVHEAYLRRRPRRFLRGGGRGDAEDSYRKCAAEAADQARRGVRARRH
jgi:hypothetical protein